MVTAVQTGVSAGIGGSKKNKKFKPLQYKLPHVNTYGTKEHTDFIETQKPSHHSVSNKKESLVTAATAATITKKVKTKLKKKKSSKQQLETTIQ